MPTSPAAALAALRVAGRYYDRRDERPVRARLDADGLGIAVELPGPRILAETYAAPRLRELGLDVYRNGAALLTRPTGTEADPVAADQLDLAADLLATLAGLPDRPDAGAPYRDLRLLATNPASAGTATAYCRDVVAAIRRHAPQWRPRAERPPIDRRPATTPADRVKAHRERVRTAEVASARWWLHGYLHDEDDPATPGARLDAAALYALAAETLAELAEDGEPIDDDAPDVLFRVPGPRTFYEVADDVLGARRRSHGVRVYFIPDPAAKPEEASMNLTDAVLERVIDRLADETLATYGDDVRDEIARRLGAGDRLGALTLQRERLAATGTDGTVVDLARARARRR